MTTLTQEQALANPALSSQLSQFPSNLHDLLSFSLHAKAPSNKHLAPPPKVVNVQEYLKTHEKMRVFHRGLQHLQSGKIGVLLLAGGQGTRLGFHKPKGCYRIDGLSRSLYEMQALQIRRLQRLEATSEASLDMILKQEDGDKSSQSMHHSSSAHKLGEVRCLIQWYIMTSPFTDDDTKAFFEKHNYFGLQKHQIHFFQQGSLPCMTEDGKFILETEKRIACAPDGNGGVYTSLQNSGILKHMRENGVQGLHMYCVDNALAKIADPIFIALCMEKEVKFAAKVIPKSYPEERVGVFAERNGKDLCVVEYSEMPSDFQNDSKFNHANILSFFYTTEFLEECASNVSKGRLPYHVARKMIPSIDSEGKPAKVEGIKLELFNFDICPLAGDKYFLLQVNREEEFAPLKNASGEKKDSPESCRAMVSRHNVKLLKSAGAIVNISEDNTSDNDMPVCEISPLISYNGEGLEAFKGKKVQLPVDLEEPKGGGNGDGVHLSV
uniref:UDP-N-acetylglucosamine diphosphorylase n=1 Tax=Percolomonas cosmopolitus TaxID=63605 RepID=A0A7S1KL96_9EUKA|eukprot:CAMPEP_0117441638 /NCGR_PEP_ID=MMETSP0759-20121206/3737_1 /TAXON_ID=63605 /ORGANISM="Percolomonas cosmopolitus, Strain WS" /LENGTH=494 /DNA_ID=CAMNT_0005233497 /DNA_START=32 /DNA_END=1516 /DNA_ORIENTATION=-